MSALGEAMTAAIKRRMEKYGKPAEKQGLPQPPKPQEPKKD